MEHARAPADTADRILRAADELFGERGFDGVSARDIAEHAGVNKALVFYHHGSKAELFEKILDRYYHAHAQALARGLSGHGTLAEQVHGLVDTYLDFIEENVHHVRLVQREIARGSQWLPQIRRGVTLLHERVAELLSGVTPERGPLASRHFFVTFSGLVNTYFLMGPALEPIWDDDPMSIANRRERREHVHWIVDSILSRMRG